MSGQKNHDNTIGKDEERAIEKGKNWQDIQGVKPFFQHPVIDGWILEKKKKEELFKRKSR